MRCLILAILLLPGLTHAAILYSAPPTQSAIVHDGDAVTHDGNPIVHYREIADDVRFADFGRVLSAEFEYSIWPAATRYVYAELYVYSGMYPEHLIAVSACEGLTPDTTCQVVFEFPLDLPVSPGDVRYFSVRLATLDPMPSSVGPFCGFPSIGSSEPGVWLLPDDAGRIWRPTDDGTLAMTLIGVPEPAVLLLALPLIMRRKR